MNFEYTFIFIFKYVFTFLGKADIQRERETKISHCFTPQMATVGGAEQIQSQELFLCLLLNTGPQGSVPSSDALVGISSDGSEVELLVFESVSFMACWHAGRALATIATILHIESQLFIVYFRDFFSLQGGSIKWMLVCMNVCIYIFILIYNYIYVCVLCKYLCEHVYVWECSETTNNLYSFPKLKES